MGYQLSAVDSIGNTLALVIRWIFLATAWPNLPSSAKSEMPSLPGLCA